MRIYRHADGSIKTTVRDFPARRRSVSTGGKMEERPFEAKNRAPLACSDAITQFSEVSKVSFVDVSDQTKVKDTIDLDNVVLTEK